MEVRTNRVPNPNSPYDTAGVALDLLGRYRNVARELTGPTAVSGALTLLGQLAHAKKRYQHPNPLAP
jgi:hypothetical protein